MSNEQLLLQYLRSIEDSVKRIEQSMGVTDANHDERITSLETSRTNFRGSATAAGAIITAMAGVVAWLVATFKN